MFRYKGTWPVSFLSFPFLSSSRHSLFFRLHRRHSFLAQHPYIQVAPVQYLVIKGKEKPLDPTVYGYGYGYGYSYSPQSPKFQRTELVLRKYKVPQLPY